MSDPKVFLKPWVVLEPLWNQWLIDVNLVPPINAAMMLVNSHLPSLKAFIASPAIHAEGAKNPALAGGQFVDLDPARVADVEALLERTQRDNAQLVALAAAVKALDALLATDAAGLGLDGAYAKVPEPLRGYVELKYDMSHRAQCRHIEGLLYRSPYFRRDAQAVDLSLATTDRRPFAYSTPRLEGPGHVFLKRPLDDAGYDDLARSWSTAISRGELEERLGITDAQRETFRTLLTEEAPARAPRFDGPGARVRYFGHACLLVESRDAAILVDPTMGSPFPGASARYTRGDLPDRLDYVLITHAHGDHFSLEALLPLRHKTDTIVVPRNGSGIVDPSLELLLRALGFPNVRSVEDMQSLEVTGGRVTAIPFLGEHADLDIRAKTSYLIELAGAKIIAGADAAGLEPRLYELVREAIPGDLDALFLAMEPHGAPLSWGYGALFPKPPPRKMDQSRRQRAATTDELIAMLDRLRPKRFFNYAMGLEPWLHHIVAIGGHTVDPKLNESDRVFQHCQQRGIPAVRPYMQLEVALP